MAFVTVHQSKKTLFEKKEITAYLANQNVHYESWEVPHSLAALTQKSFLTPEDKSTVLAAFAPQLNRLRVENGYIENDIISLCPETPNIDQLLSKFDKEHYHTDDEVRFILSGRGIFGFEGTKGERFTIEVTAGDYIVIPKNGWHWFMLGQDRDLKAIRLFQDMSGWVPYYRQPATATPAILQ